MVDPWDRWDAAVKQVGKPERAAQRLSDAELLRLLAAERRGERDVEKRLVCDELLARLHAARRDTDELSLSGRAGADVEDANARH